MVRPELDDPPTVALHHRRAPGIGLLLIGVMLAVDFDHEFARDAGEVREVRTDRMLSPELGARDATLAQEFPHFALCPAAVAAQFACTLATVVVSGHIPSPNLSPKGERNMRVEECGDSRPSL